MERNITLTEEERNIIKNALCLYAYEIKKDRTTKDNADKDLAKLFEKFW